MKNEKTDLWKALERKFCVDLKRDFSNKDIPAWISHFAPHQKIRVSQHGNGKDIQFYTGNLVESLLHGRIPAKLMAWLYFRKLAKQHYSHSDIQLLGIRQIGGDENAADAHIRFLRYDTSGTLYESAMGIYSLVQINQVWLIREMSIYADDVRALRDIDLSDMWFPGKEN